METAIRWSDQYNTGNEEIDGQHKELVTILSYLRDHGNSCLEKSETEDIFNQLEDFADRHFQLEEDIMQKTNFPYAKSHIRDHRYFSDHIREWRTDGKIGCRSHKLSDFLTEWFFEHILQQDRKLTEHLGSVQ